jgi:hypothetical protein
MLARGRVHDINLWVVLAVNAALYSWLVFRLIQAWLRKKSEKNLDHAGMPDCAIVLKAE